MEQLNLVSDFWGQECGLRSKAADTLNMKLTDWARSEGLHPKTAYRWYREGKLPYPARKVGTRTILIDVPASPAGEQKESVALYARVSSHDQKNDLDRQVARLSQWAARENLHITTVVAEVGSGMNGKRAKLGRLLADPATKIIVVEYRDRLGRMNVELVEAALAASGRELRVVETRDVDDDLVRDVTEVLVSFCARPSRGNWSAENRAAKALACASGVETLPANNLQNPVG